MLARAACASLTLALLGGCASTSRVAAEWTDPAFRVTSIHRVMVLGVMSDPMRGQALEDALARALSGSGIPSVTRAESRGAGRPDSAEWATRAIDREADGILVARWVDSRLFQANYSPVTTYVAVPSGYAAGWFSYYTSAAAHADSVGSAISGAATELASTAGTRASRL